MRYCCGLVALIGFGLLTGSALGDSVTFFGALQLTNRPDDGTDTQAIFSGSLPGSGTISNSVPGASGSANYNFNGNGFTLSNISLSVSGDGVDVPGFDELATAGDLGFVPNVDVIFSLNGSLTYAGVDSYPANAVSLDASIFTFDGGNFVSVSQQSQTRNFASSASLSIADTGLLHAGQLYYYLPDIALDGTTIPSSGTATGALSLSFTPVAAPVPLPSSASAGVVLLAALAGWTKLRRTTSPR